MRRIGLAIMLAIGLLAMPLGGGAQPGRIYGVGVVHQGGAYRQSVDGLLQRVHSTLLCVAEITEA